MTKQQEIEVLTKAISTLGPDSYLGPWLSQIKAEVESLVRSDIFPDITLNDAIKSGDGIKLNAIAAAAVIVNDAKLKADKIGKDADRCLEDAASRLQAAVRELTKF